MNLKDYLEKTRFDTGITTDEMVQKIEEIATIKMHNGLVDMLRPETREYFGMKKIDSSG